MSEDCSLRKILPLEHPARPTGPLNRAADEVTN